MAASLLGEGGHTANGVLEWTAYYQKLMWFTVVFLCVCFELYVEQWNYKNLGSACQFSYFVANNICFLFEESQIF